MKSLLTLSRMKSNLFEGFEIVDMRGDRDCFGRGGYPDDCIDVVLRGTFPGRIVHETDDDFLTDRQRGSDPSCSSITICSASGFERRVTFDALPAGTVIEPHSHDTENVGVITRGNLLLTMDGKTEQIGAGEWYHVPEGQEHAAEFTEDTAGIEFWFKKG